MNTRTIIGAVALALSVAFPQGANAEDVTFTTDNGDLASWGGTSGDRLRFASSGSITATASANKTFNGLFMDNSNQTVTLDMREAVSGGAPRVITLDDHVYFNDAKKTQTLNIKGGRWNLASGKNLFFRGSTAGGGMSYANTGTSDRFNVNITDGAVMNMNGLFVGYGPNSRSGIYVAGEGTVITTVALRVGNINACHDKIVISNGAEVVVTSTKSDNPSHFLVGYTSTVNGSRNCSLTVTGAGSRLIKPNGGLGGIGHEYSRECSLSVTDGATAEISGTLQLAGTLTQATYGSNNVITVSGNGSSLALETLYLGFSVSNKNIHNHDNALKVLDGGVVTGDLLYTGGNGNGVVVSNATARFTKGGMRENDNQNYLGTNFYVRLQGAAPSFTTDNTARAGARNVLYKSFRFIYDLPADGYANGHTPVQFLWESVTDGSLEVEVNGIEAVLQSMEQREEYRRSMVLLSAPGGWTTGHGITSAMVERWNSRLPEGGKLFYANNALTLVVKRKAGIIISVF